MQASPVVADSSVLIAFHEVGSLDLLQSLFPEIVIPPAVAQEIAPSVGNTAGWLTVVRPLTMHDAVRSLDTGEREAISLAMELSASRVLLDDLPARRIAMRLSLPIVGSVGVLLAAKEQGRLTQVRPLMDAMRRGSLYLKDAVYWEILRSAGEA
ncbi:MAG: DUF3368 domain-containing protein [Thermomicrobiales bacterium]